MSALDPLDPNILRSAASPSKHDQLFSSPTPRDKAVGSLLAPMSPSFQDDSYDFDESVMSHGDDDDDDTIASGFSAPDLTLWARDVTKSNQDGLEFEPNSVDRQIKQERGFLRNAENESPTRRMSPTKTPRTITKGGSARDLTYSRFNGSPKKQVDGNMTTNLLLDFTEQFNAISNTRTYQSSAVKRQVQSYEEQSTPRARNPASLIDFDIPVPPTPRSIPTITPRELEDLKSSHISQLAGLRAELKGKEAIISELNNAITDAEQRAGESRDEVREWQEKLQDEQEQVKKLKQELAKREREVADHMAIRTNLEKQTEELQHLLKKQKDSPPPAPVHRRDAIYSEQQQQEAIEKVGRELHALYKQKHENKVSALKKSYETRWSNKVSKLEEELASVQSDFAAARTSHAEALTEASSAAIDSAEQVSPVKRPRRMSQTEEGEIRRLRRRVDDAEDDAKRLRLELEQERKERGELVALVEELLAMQSGGGASSEDAPAVAGVMDAMRGSISRAGGAAYGFHNSTTTPRPSLPRPMSRASSVERGLGIPRSRRGSMSDGEGVGASTGRGRTRRESVEPHSAKREKSIPRPVSVVGRGRFGGN